MRKNRTDYWIYGKCFLADRRTVQFLLAKQQDSGAIYPFLTLLLDDDNWAKKLDALQHLGDALRFVALTRSVLQGKISRDQAFSMKIGDGLRIIGEKVGEKAVVLDRGLSVGDAAHVRRLFDGLRQLWNAFSQMSDDDGRTFLDHFECQQVNVNAKLPTLIGEQDALVLVLAGNGSVPETSFVCQLLSQAVQAAASVASSIKTVVPSIEQSGRYQLSCASAASMAQFDESRYAHVDWRQFDRFLDNHAIDEHTLKLAETFAMTSVLGTAGSTIAEDVRLENITEFVFRETTETVAGNLLLDLEGQSLAWQPTPIDGFIEDRILDDLDEARALSEARLALISVIQHVQQDTEPLRIGSVREKLICDVVSELSEMKVIIKEYHVSSATLDMFNKYVKLEVRHAFGLLKRISARMQGIPSGWDAMLSDDVAEETRRQLGRLSRDDGVVETLLQLVNIINTAEAGGVPAGLMPEENLFNCMRQTLGGDWNGIPNQLQMKHLGHVLSIAESIQ